MPQIDTEVAVDVTMLPKIFKNIPESLWALSFNVRRYGHIAVDVTRLPQILEMFRKHCGPSHSMSGGIDMSLLTL